ncbi:MAG: hypothetical protein U0361_22640 [Nitrospiraceae bacterium]
MIPSDLRYHEEHESVRVQGQQGMCTGHFAQEALGDIVFIDLPKLGAKVTRVEGAVDRGEAESTKTTSTIYTPKA